MSKSKTFYVCQECGAEFGKWQGQCDACGQWNCLAEKIGMATASGEASTSGGKRGRSKQGGQLESADLSSYLVSYDDNFIGDGFSRFSTGIEEFDRVLGADESGQGMVRGSVVLIGGEPGIGKSTLLSELMISLLIKNKVNTGFGEIMYVAGEESPNQISLRLKRMVANLPKEKTKQSGLMENLKFVTTTDVDELVELIKREQPKLLVVDSIQTMSTRDLAGPAGSLGQVKECAERITVVSKEHNIPTFLVGHVNKDGAIAGPKTLEHIVDAILELEGERGGDLRFLRAVKNRFGATDEVGVFRLVENGVEEVKNPSGLFLEQLEKGVPGSAIAGVMEGTRPMLIEVQALVIDTQLAMPRRVGRGVDLPRIQTLCAVAQKQLRLPLGMNDVFLSVSGGMTVREPSIELGLVAAMVSSLAGKALPERSVFIGEVGLMGEIRTVTNLERRLKEAKRLGYEKIYSRQTHRRLSELFKELRLI